MTRTLRMMGIILTVMTLFSTGNSPVNAQVPQAFNYQSVARNSTGDLIQNQLVTFRISILQDSPEGTLLYRESHAVTTNDFGLANLQIGKGSVLDGTFSGIDWSTGQKHLKVELDPTGGSSFIEMGTSELLSVPYALFADNTDIPPEISDADGDTKVQAEKNSNEDIIRFDLGGSERMVIRPGRIETNNINQNLFIGKYAGLTIPTGENNIGIGDSALINTTTGIGNTAVGGVSLELNTTGFNNTAIGSYTLNYNSTGYVNTAIGNAALSYNETGHENTALGSCALTYNNSSYNTATGNFALYSNVGGNHNVANGYRALMMNIDGNSNVAIGDSALCLNTTSGNVAVGSKAGMNNTTGHNNLFSGYHAGMANTIGYFNTFLGTYSGYSNSNGFGNTFTGYYSGQANTTGFGNSFYGHYAGAMNTDGNFNSYFGENTGSSNAGHNNSFFGAEAGLSLTSGSNNILMGYKAGKNLTTGSNNIILGYDIAAPLPAGSNQMVIGAADLLYGDLSNKRIGIGTFSPDPSSVLDITSTTGGILIPRMTTVQRQAIPLPVKGLLIFDITTNSFWFNNGSTWLEMGIGSSTDINWAKTGNNIYNTNTGSVGIGTSAPKGKMDINLYKGGTAGSLVTDYSHQLVLGGNYDTGPNQTGVKLWIGDYNNDGTDVFPIYCEDENNKVDFWIKNRANQTTAMPTMFFDGRFGLGTTEPLSSRLHLEGANSYDATIRLNNTGTNGTDFFMSSTSDNWGTGGAKFVMGHGLAQSSNVDIVIDDEGELGLGLTNPTGRLHIQAASGSSSSFSEENGLVIQDGSYNDANEIEVWDAAGTTIKMVLSDNGSLGLGTMDPGDKFEINGNNSEAGLRVAWGPQYSTVFGEIKHGGSGGFKINACAGGGWADLSLQTDGTTRMFVESAGNIGINTTSPVSKLTIQSSLGSGKTLVLKDVDLNTGNDFEIQDYDGNLNLVVTDAGRVGIGTDNPTHLLSVNGTIRSKEVIVNTNWSDFVFESDYKLMPLHELDKFITDNKHLPEIPSADEVEENGISLGNMDAKLLQKIEELTLYIIELQKQVNDLKEKQ